MSSSAGSGSASTFRRSYSNDFKILCLQDKKIGYASAYECALAFLTEIESMRDQKTIFNNEVVSKLEVDIVNMEKLLQLVKDFESYDFCQAYLMTGPLKLRVPSYNNKVKYTVTLGTAKIKLIAAVLADRMSYAARKFLGTSDPAKWNSVVPSWKYTSMKILMDFGFRLADLAKILHVGLIDRIDAVILNVQFQQKQENHIKNLEKIKNHMSIQSLLLSEQVIKESKSNIDQFNLARFINMIKNYYHINIAKNSPSDTQIILVSLLLMYSSMHYSEAKRTYDNIVELLVYGMLLITNKTITLTSVHIHSNKMRIMIKTTINGKKICNYLITTMTDAEMVASANIEAIDSSALMAQFFNAINA
jgi:hypothetical protein